MPKVAPLLFALLIATSAFAQQVEFGKNKVQYDSFQWEVYHSKHFDVYFYPEESRLAAQTTLLAEQAWQRLSLRLGHSPRERIPLLLYASHPSFQQTNVTPSLISEGTGGFTDIDRSRIVVPYTGSVPALRHVITHELVHAFMLDILFGGQGAKSTLSRVPEFRMPPLWFVEGLAEYLSTGWDAEAQLYIEDAVASDYLQELPYLQSGFLVYKEGQALVRYLAETYGEGILGGLLSEMAGRGNLEKALKKRTGQGVKGLSRDFLRDLRGRVWNRIHERKAPSHQAFPLLDHEKSKPNFFLRPSFSPDGERLAYFADHKGEINLYLASSVDGKVIRKLVTGHRSSEVESLHPFDSGACFSPDGSQLAFVALHGGRDELVLVESTKGREVARFPSDLEVLRQPSWSPDGARIAVSAVRGGVSDLFALNLDDATWSRLTHDLEDEQDPVWTPSGDLVFARHRAIAPGLFNAATDTEPQNLDPAMLGDRPELFDFGRGYDLFVLGREGEVRPLPSTAGNDRSPMFLPGEGLLFVSDVAGMPELWRLADGDSAPQRIYAPGGGVIGPCLAADGKRLAFSSLQGGGYSVFTLEDLPALLRAADDQTPPDKLAFLPFPDAPESGELPLPPAEPADAEPDTLLGLQEPYRVRFLVDSFGRQVVWDTQYGLYGSTVLRLKDVLGDHEVLLYLDLFGNIDDSNFMLSYTRRKSRLNWSLGAFSFLNLYQTHVSSLEDFFPEDRLFLEWSKGAFLAGTYPLSIFTRVDADLNFLYSLRRYYDGVDPWGRPIPTPDPENPDAPLEEQRLLLQPRLSLVHDDALFDYLGPVRGSRWKLAAGWTKSLGGEVPVNRWTGVADWRGYLLGPAGHSLALRLALRASGGEDPVWFHLGGPTNLRGYDYLAFAGTRSALASLEWRFPFIRYLWIGGPIPMRWAGVGGSIFADLGGAWTENSFVAFDQNSEELRLGDLKADFGYGFRFGLGGWWLLMLDIAWSTDLQSLGPRQTQISIGAQF